jgi:hypothetical protein
VGYRASRTILLHPIITFRARHRLSSVSKLKALLVTILLTVSASAQTTWKNLHFGDTRDVVRSALAAQNFAVETSQDGSLQSVSNYDILLPGMRNTLPLRANFHFADSGGLMDVTLSLDFPAMRHIYPNLRGDDVMLAFAADKFNRALTDKYGIPLFKRAECDADAVTLAKTPNAVCTINWRDPAQSIELDWLTHTPRLFIRYQMLSPDL